MGRHSNRWSRYLIGWGLILVGGFFLLEKLGVDLGPVWSLWPVVLIIFGIGVLARRG